MDEEIYGSDAGEVPQTNGEACRESEVEETETNSVAEDAMENVFVKLEPEDASSDEEESDGVGNWLSSSKGLEDFIPKVEIKTEDDYDCPQFSQLDDETAIAFQELKLNCPPSLQSYTEDEMFSAFQRCFSRKAKLGYHSKNSLFGRVSMFLTQEKTSTFTERRYLYDLWDLKYKRQFVDPVKKQILKVGKHQRKKYQRWVKSGKLVVLPPAERPATAKRKRKSTCPSEPQLQKVLLYVKREVSEDNEDNGLDYNGRPNSPAAMSPKVKEEVDSDYNNDAEVDSSISLSFSTQNKRQTNPQDVKLKKKRVIKSRKKLKDDSIPGQRLRLRPRKKQKKKDYIESFSDTESETNYLSWDEDFQPWTSQISKYRAKKLAKKKQKHQRIIGVRINDKNSSDQSTCSVCGRPLNEVLKSFHMRTHLNLEEQKNFFIERREKEKEIRKAQIKRHSSNIHCKEISSESRLDQLKSVLGRLEKKYEKKTYEKEELVIRRKRLFIRRHPNVKMHVKRDGNYGPVQCSLCGKILCTIYRLKAHEVGVHGFDGKQFKCSICGRTFGAKGHVDYHMRTHLSFEERSRFVTWPGTIMEFIERLNSGEDLDKPPEKPLRIFLKKGRMPRNRKFPIGRGKHTRKRKTGSILKQDKSAAGPSEVESNDVITNDNIGVDHHQSVSVDGYVPALPSSTVDTSILSWNFNFTQGVDTFCTINNFSNC